MTRKKPRLVQPWLMFNRKITNYALRGSTPRAFLVTVRAGALLALMLGDLAAAFLS